MKLRQAVPEVLVITRRALDPRPFFRWVNANLMDVLFIFGLVVLVVTSWIVAPVFGGYVLALALIGYAWFLTWARSDTKPLTWQRTVIIVTMLLIAGFLIWTAFVR